MLTAEITLLLLVGFSLRFLRLGYSDFQGDEINAICHASEYESLLSFARFLLDQRKGPVQYLITCAYSLLDPAFSSELALRLPFAVASGLGLAAFYLLVWRWFGKRTAALAGFLLATNGLFVAFGRIVQYQSVVLLTTTASLLLLTLAIDRPRWRLAGLYASATLAAVGLLTHFDAVFALPPLAVLAVLWQRAYRQAQGRGWPHLAAATVWAGLLVLPFYLAYARRLGPFQLAYWGDRVTAAPTDTLGLLRFYNPGPIVWVYLIAAALAVFQLQRTRGWVLTLAWLLPPLVFMEFVFHDSRTHVYTYLLPLMIVAGHGLAGALAWARSYAGDVPGRIAQVVVGMVVLGLAWASFAVLIDPQPEYPWSPKRVLWWQADGGYLQGTFGFPYNRQWRAIGQWFETAAGEAPIVVTNEKLVITTFYLPPDSTIHYRSRVQPESLAPGDQVYVLVVERPQSWVDGLWGWPLAHWSEEFTAVEQFSRTDGGLQASVYRLTADQIAEYFP